MPSAVAELLDDLAAALRQGGIDWYLFGAQAAILHGVARLTADVDVTVRLGAETSNEQLATLLERYRFQRRVSDPTFIERTRVVPFVHAPTALPLDVVIAGPGLEDLFFEHVEARDVEGATVRVASIEDLIVMKILAGREKDVADVRAMVAASSGRLDSGYVERTLAILEDALGQSDLRPLFRQILEGR